MVRGHLSLDHLHVGVDLPQHHFRSAIYSLLSIHGGVALLDHLVDLQSSGAELGEAPTTEGKEESQSGEVEGDEERGTDLEPRSVTIRFRPA